MLEWEAFDTVEPIGGQRGDWQVASICRTLMDIATARADPPTSFTTEQFLLKFQSREDQEAAPKAPPPPSKPRQSWQQQKMIAMMYVAASQARKRKR